MASIFDSFQSATARSTALKIEAALTRSLFPETGPIPIWFQSTPTTPAAQTIVDCFGIVKDCRPDEALFYGARRVENLLRYTEHLSSTGIGKWETLNGLTVLPVEDVTRPGVDGSLTAWRISRAAVASSVLRTSQFLRRRSVPAGLDLLAPLPHFFGINMRRATTNVVSTVELQAYVSGSGPTVYKTVTIDDTMRTYGIVFTPAAPRRITGLSWSGGVLTVTCPSHGYSAGNNIRLTGSLPAAFDLDGQVASVVNTNTFTVSMGNNPGMPTSFGWTQYGYRIALSPGSFASTVVGDIEAEHPYVSEFFGYPNGRVPEYVPQDAFPPDRYWYGAAVDGVCYFDTDAGWIYNASTGLVTRGIGADLPAILGLATFAQATNLVPRKFAELLGGWARADTSMTLVDLADISPLGFTGAARIVEGSHVGRHYCELPAGVLTTSNTSDNVLSNISVFMATPTDGDGRDWAVLNFVDRAAIEQYAYFNLGTGLIGSKTSGVRAIALERLVSLNGLAWYRVHMRVTMGSGTSAPTVRIGLASGDGGASYPGDGAHYIVVWGVDIVGGTVGRPVAAPYGRAHQESSAVRAGSMLQWNVRGLLDPQDFAVRSTCTPYFDPMDVDRQDWSGITYIDCGGPQMVPGATTSNVSFVTGDRLGAFFRPNPYPGSVHFSKVAVDYYRGDPTNAYLFRSGKAYALNEYVVPSDTRAGNLNARNLWRVKVAGVSSTEPNWPTVTSLPSADINTGSAVFVCDHDNGILGKYEPYDGAQLLPPSGFMVETRVGWYLTEFDYGLFLNGTDGEKQTAPSPIDPSGYAMRFRPKVLGLGRLPVNYAIDDTTMTPYSSTDGANMMPRLTMFHRDLSVWNGVGMPTTDLEKLTS